jgi:hypothetical protein
MKTIEGATFMRPLAFAASQNLLPVRAAVRCIWPNLLTYGLAGILAVCLLPALTNKVWAQFLCGPNDTICVPAFGWCEPITTPAARAMCPRRAAPPPRQRQPGSARIAPPAVGGAPQGFQPELVNLIKPLNCPLHVPGLIRVAPTFYGGTRCAYSTPSLASGEQLPWEPPPPSPAPTAGPPPPQAEPGGTAPSQPSQPREISQPTQRNPLPEPPPPSQAATDVNKDLANSYWKDVGETMKTAWPAVAGPLFFAGGFALRRLGPLLIAAW